MHGRRMHGIDPHETDTVKDDENLDHGGGLSGKPDGTL